MNIQELSKEDYKYFNRTGARKTHFVKGLQYIQMLGVSSGNNLTEWDILKIFASDHEKEIVTDKGEINKRFFEFVESTKGPRSAQIAKIMADTAERIAKAREAVLPEVIQRYENDARALSNRYLDYHREAESFMKRVCENYFKMEALKTSSGTMAEGITQLMEEGLYEFDRLEGNTLYLNLVGEVILIHKNLAQKIDLTVNLGKFKVSVGLGDFNLLVHPHEDNVLVDGFYHPHVEGRGRVCWGNAAASMADHNSKGRVAESLRLLAQLLRNYNPESPYRALSSYYARYQALLAQKKLPADVSVDHDDQNGEPVLGDPFSQNLNQYLSTMQTAREHSQDEISRMRRSVLGQTITVSFDGRHLEPAQDVHLERVTESDDED